MGGVYLRAARGRATKSRWSGAVAVLGWMALAAAPIAAQQREPVVTETVETRSETDVNGRDAVWEKVVTRHSQASDREDVVIEVYRPAIHAGELALNRRIRRVTTPTADGSRTVEEMEMRSPGFPQDPAMKVVRRCITTVRRSGPDTYVSERQEFELDVNGRFVPLRREVVELGNR